MTLGITDKEAQPQEPRNANIDLCPLLQMITVISLILVSDLTFLRLKTPFKHQAGIVVGPRCWRRNGPEDVGLRPGVGVDVNGMPGWLLGYLRQCHGLFLSHCRGAGYAAVVRAGVRWSR
jgi:hypothetical protein